jgi:hypothetical protein
MIPDEAVEGGQRTVKGQWGLWAVNVFLVLCDLHDFDCSTNPVFVLTHNYFVEKASF